MFSFAFNFFISRHYNSSPSSSNSEDSSSSFILYKVGFKPNIEFKPIVDASKSFFLFISDVADIVAKVILNQFTGELNIATGKVHTFFEIAKIISQMGGSKSKIISTPRVGGMPHNGYRPFSINKLEAFYPDLLSTSIYNGIKEMFEKEI